MILIVSLVCVSCAVELILCVVLIVPLGNGVKQSVVEWLDRQKWLAPVKYLLVTLMCVIAVLFGGDQRILVSKQPQHNVSVFVFVLGCPRLPDEGATIQRHVGGQRRHCQPYVPPNQY